jgi:hypothetical protein
MSHNGGYWQRDAERFADYYRDQRWIKRVVSWFLDSRGA